MRPGHVTEKALEDADFDKNDRSAIRKENNEKHFLIDFFFSKLKSLILMKPVSDPTFFFSKFFFLHFRTLHARKTILHCFLFSTNDF